MTWEEDTPEHGKYYYYKIVSVLNGPDGTPYNGSNNGKSVKVGKTIDPATEYVLPPQKRARSQGGYNQIQGSYNYQQRRYYHHR